MHVIQDFYSVRSVGSSRNFIADADFGEADPIAVTRGERAVRLVHAKRAAGAKEPSDIVWTTFVGPMFMSPRIRKLLHDNEVTGWCTYPVEILVGQATYEYFGLVVTGRCGSLVTKREEMKRFPAGQFPILRGICFGIDTWDGSELFMSTDLSAWVFSVGRVKSLVSNYVKNVNFEPLTDVEQI